MEKKDNPIFDRYRNMIVDAFISLTQHLPYNEITILRITQEANISRQTFYRHFKSKDEILAELMDSISKEVTQKLQTLVSPTRKEIFKTYLSFWVLHKDFLHIISNGHIESWLISAYEDVMQKQLEILKPYFQNLSQNEFKLVKTFLIGGLYQLKTHWCTHHFHESPEYLASLLDNIFV